MRRKIVSATVLSLILFAAGCKSSSGSKKGSLTGDKERIPGFFHEIPAKSFYAFTGLQPVPEEIIREQLEGGQGTFVTNFLEMASSGGDGVTEKIAGALLEELKGNMSPKGFKKLGLSLSPHAAVYSVGSVPFFRMSLSDPDAFEAMLNRVETKADVDVRMKTSGDQKYRVYTDGELKVPVVVRDGAVVGAAYRKPAGEVLLPYVLGEREPKKSMADAGTIRELVDTYDYRPYAAGYFDIRRFTRTVTGVRKPSARTKAVFKSADMNVETASEVCKKEIRSVTNTAPRFVIGTTELTSESVEYEAGVELQGEIAEEFDGLTSPVVGADTELFDESLLAVGIGLDVMRSWKMMRGHAEAISKEPYQCETLEELNAWAKRYERQPIPTVVSQLKGASLLIKSARFRGRRSRPKDLQAMALVRMTNPQTLIGRLKTVVPGLMKADIKDDGVPVPIEKLSQRAPFLKAPHVALEDDVLGFSVGVGMQDELGALLEGPESAATDTALAVRYDLDKVRAAIPRWIKKEADENLGESFLKSTLTGGGQFSVLFRQNGIFVSTEQDRGKGGKTSSGPSGTETPSSNRRAAAE